MQRCIQQYTNGDLFRLDFLIVKFLLHSHGFRQTRVNNSKVIRGVVRETANWVTIGSYLCPQMVQEKSCLDALIVKTWEVSTSLRFVLAAYANPSGGNSQKITLVTSCWYIPAANR